MSEQPTQPEAKKSVVPLRALVVNLLFSMFTSLVIFAVATYYFLVPQILNHSAEIAAVKAQVQELDERTAAPEPTDEEAQATPPADAQPTDGAAAAAPAAADQAAQPAAAPADPAAAPAAQPAAQPAGAQAAPATP